MWTQWVEVPANKSRLTEVHLLSTLLKEAAVKHLDLKVVKQYRTIINKTMEVNMLSRVADGMFWLNRYMERTDGMLLTIHTIHFILR
jgi:hypothetical protein